MGRCVPRARILLQAHPVLASQEGAVESMTNLEQWAARIEAMVGGPR